MSDYAAFLAAKSQVAGDDGRPPEWTPEFLFGFQADLVEWACHKGRAAIFADCGLGKTPMMLVWAGNVRRFTGRPVLIVTPLAVGFQTVAEADKFGISAGISRDGRPRTADVTVTNYERLHLFDPADYGGVVCDESSAIKAFDGVRRKIVTDFLRRMPWRLLCTATAAPNDYIELGTSSEALGYLGYMDMLSRFFTQKPLTGPAAQRGWGHAMRDSYRFKGHAEEPFWKWVASWARALRKPSDLGYDDTRFQLPPLNRQTHVISARQPAGDRLFDVAAQGLHEERAEARRTITERCEAAAGLIADADTGIVWVQLNAEGDMVTRLVDGAVQVSGADDPDAKEEAFRAFTNGDIRVLVTKPSIGAWGLNWQHCNRMVYLPSHSYEQYYQAVRRCWRFGQTRPVTVDVVTTEGGERTLANLERKADQAAAMFDALVAHMRCAVAVDRDMVYDRPVEGPSWLT